MKREDAIALCRYYQGEEKASPHYNAEHRNLWKYEKYWCELVVDDSSSETFNEYLQDYYSAGLRELCVTDNVPITLKALLYNRYQHHNDGIGDVDMFRQWYTEKYSH